MQYNIASYQYFISYGHEFTWRYEGAIIIN